MLMGTTKRLSDLIVFLPHSVLYRIDKQSTLLRVNVGVEREDFKIYIPSLYVDKSYYISPTTSQQIELYSDKSSFIMIYHNKSQFNMTIIITQTSNVVRTTSYWNNLRQGTLKIEKFESQIIFKIFGSKKIKNSKSKLYYITINRVIS